MEWLRGRASSPGALNNQISTVTSSDVIAHQVRSLVISVYKEDSDNEGNTIANRKCTADEVESHDNQLLSNLNNIFFVVGEGRGDEQEPPPENTDIGGYQFELHRFVPMSENGVRNRTFSRALKNNTGHAKSTKLDGYSLNVLGRNRVVNISLNPLLSFAP